MLVSAFQTHSEVGVGGSSGPVEFWGLFFRYLVKGEGEAPLPGVFQEDVLPNSFFHDCFREAEVTSVVTRVT